MSRLSVVLCGVPEAYCTGGKYSTDQKLPARAHSDSDEAFRCMCRYLRKMGYTQNKFNSREWKPPDGGPVRILTKRSRYGSRLRRGKDRFMPEAREQGNRGVIIKT